MRKQNKYVARCYRFLRFISPGKISLGLYYRNSLQYGSTFGGMVSITLSMLMIIYSGFVFAPLFDGSGKTFEFYTKDIRTLLNNTSINNREILPKIISLDAILTDVTNYDEDYCQRNLSFILYSYNELLVESGVSYDDIAITSHEIQENTVSCSIMLQDFYQSSKYAVDILDSKGSLYNPYNDRFRMNFSFGIKTNDPSSNSGISNVIVNYNYSSINSDKQEEQIGFLSLDNEFSEVTITFDLLNSTADIFGVFEDFKSELFINDMSSYLNYGDKKQFYKIQFLIDKNIKITVEYSYTIWALLSKIGGLFAILKIFSSLIKMIHYKLFEKKLNRIKAQLDDENDSDEETRGLDQEKLKKFFTERKTLRINDDNESLSIRFTESGKEFEQLSMKDFFSFKIFVQMAQEITDQKGLLNIQQQEINELRSQYHQLMRKYE